MRVDAAALSTCTPLMITPTAAWPDMTACMALWPKREATATTAVCKYEPADACSMPVRSTKVKKTPGCGWNQVLAVSKAVKSASHVKEKSTRREFDAFRNIKVNMGALPVNCSAYLLRSSGRVREYAKIGDRERRREIR